MSSSFHFNPKISMNKNLKTSRIPSAHNIKQLMISKSLINSFLKTNKNNKNNYTTYKDSTIKEIPSYLFPKKPCKDQIKSSLNKYQRYTKDFKKPYKISELEKPKLLQTRSIDTISRLIHKSSSFLPNIKNLKNKSFTKYHNYICNTNRNEKITYTNNELLNLFPKMKPIKIYTNSPIKRNNSINEDLLENEDKVNINYFDDYSLQKKIMDSLHRDFNTLDKNDIYYKNFLKSTTNYINFIFDINMLPHIQNNFFLRKPIDDKKIIAEKLSSRSLLEKRVAISMNRNIIKKLIMNKLKEEEKMNKMKKMKENKKKKIYILEDEAENKEKELFEVEIKDYFMKYHKYNYMEIATQKFKDIVYKINEKKKNI